VLRPLFAQTVSGRHRPSTGRGSTQKGHAYRRDPFRPASRVRRDPSGRRQNAVALDRQVWSSHITFMALSRKKATTFALDPEDDRLLSRAARERGVSRSEFVRQHLALVLEQYRRHPKPRSAGIVRGLTERGDERELFAGGR
jgi:hypothetical protein